MSATHELKQRNHRKLVVTDGSAALMGGRNLSHEYYTGFQEVCLKPDTPWRVVPWLDAGARVEGPAVGRLEHAFLEAWTDASGDRFDITDPPPAGKTNARVVVHHRLRDAYTVEAYLALIETARSHIYAVNGFPLLLAKAGAQKSASSWLVRARSDPVGLRFVSLAGPGIKPYAIGDDIPRDDLVASVSRHRAGQAYIHSNTC